MFGFTNPMAMQGAANPQAMGRTAALMSAMGPQIPMYQGPTTNMIQPSLPAPPAPGGQAQGAAGGMGGLMNPQMLAMLAKYMHPAAGAGSVPPATPMNNFYYGLTGGQGNPAMYGSGPAGGLT